MTAIHTVLPLAAAEGLSAGSVALLVLAVGLALAFEFVNGFHDTANAVATVIYTHALPPRPAVVWSGLCNLAGVLYSNGLVAFTILALLPADLVLNVGSAAGFAMIFALLLSAIAWNLGTWYLGLPASSSHTLVGSILGVGLANAVLAGRPWVDGVNWHKVGEVFVWLAVSPAVGFAAAAGLLLTLKRVVRAPALFQPPPKDAPPPWPVRGTLIATCTGVSFFHGSNDGQKGLGLVLLILTAILPAEYALNLNADAADLRRLGATAARVQPLLDGHAAGGKVAAALAKPVGPAGGSSSSTANADELSRYLQTNGKLTPHTYAAVAAANRELADLIRGRDSLRDVPPADRDRLRADLYAVDRTLAKLVATGRATDPAERSAYAEHHARLDGTTQYIPTWVKLAVAAALGCGTMVGWQRIVTTVGEKIGKQHLTYAQGLSAELVAMATIAAGDATGRPISTTHVLSGGIAGTMAANRSGLQMATLRNILLAWVLTLPVCVVLGATLFAAGLLIVLSQAAAVVAAVVVGAAVTCLAVSQAVRRRGGPAVPIRVPHPAA